MSRADAAPAADAVGDLSGSSQGSSMLGELLRRAWMISAGALLAGAAAFAVCTLVPPTFTAKTSFIPPQQSQASAATALASLGPLASLAGAASGFRSSNDQFVALMMSVTVSDRIIDQFKLMTVYDEKLRVDTRRELAKNVRFSIGKKDGLLNVEVDDESPQRAADMANRYVDELRRISSTLAVTEAQQRRVFFERQLGASRDRLAHAQQQLQASGYNPGALKAEPKAAAESYARVRAEITAAEMRLQMLRGSLSDETPEVRQQQAALSTLRGQLGRLEQTDAGNVGPDYVSRYRDFKYQEALFELYARQFELARVDESREGALFQVVDPATPPERKSKPRRTLITAGAALGAALALSVWVALRAARRASTLGSNSSVLNA